MLYKYLSGDRIDVLRNRAIRFSPPAAFNDPFDLRPSFDLMSRADLERLPDAPNQEASTGPKRKQLTPEAVDNMLRAIAPGIRASLADLNGAHGMFALDNNQLAQNTLGSKYGVLCLAEQPDNLLMWAHYADCHRGFVMQFDETHPFFQSEPRVPFSTLEKIEYSPHRPVLSSSNLESTIALFRKSPEWSYEREWRLVRHLAAANQVIVGQTVHLFDVPPEAVRSIILGAMMPAEKQVEFQAIVQVPEWKHLQLFYAALNRDRFALDFHPPLDGSAPTAQVCTSR